MTITSGKQAQLYTGHLWSISICQSNITGKPKKLLEWQENEYREKNKEITKLTWRLQCEYQCLHESSLSLCLLCQWHDRSNDRRPISSALPPFHTHTHSKINSICLLFKYLISKIQDGGLPIHCRHQFCIIMRYRDNCLPTWIFETEIFNNRALQRHVLHHSPNLWRSGALFEKYHNLSCF